MEEEVGRPLIWLYHVGSELGGGLGYVMGGGMLAYTKVAVHHQMSGGSAPRCL